MLGRPDHNKAFKDDLMVLRPFTATCGGDPRPVAAVFALPAFQGQVFFALVTGKVRISAREGADTELCAADDDAGQPFAVASYPMRSDAAPGADPALDPFEGVTGAIGLS
jgi:hypothetical protein